MHSKHIDVSYFAAGIVAHLASEGEWTVETISEQEMTNDLVSTLFVSATNIACQCFFSFSAKGGLRVEDSEGGDGRLPLLPPLLPPHGGQPAKGRPALGRLGSPSRLF